MSNKKRILSAFPFFDEECITGILQDIELTLKSGVLIDGIHTKDFEKKFAEYIKVEHAVAVSSATAALEMALRYFKVRDREVIVPTNTFVATPNSVLFAGGKPVFADIREDTLCIDPEDVRRKLSPRTAGVIVVHVGGLVCPQMDELMQLCEDYRLFLLEDAAHAHGAIFKGRMAGALGDAGCFSFYPTKVMTSGLGGMLTTDDSGLAEAARLMRTHGQNTQGQMILLGNEWRLSEISAIVGRHQLERLELFIKRRNEIAECYSSALRNVPGISLFQTPPYVRHSYYKFALKLSEDMNREKLAALLRDEYGVETGHLYYPPCHLQLFYKEHFGTREGDLPVAESVLRRVLCLPMHAALSDEDAFYVAESLKTLCNKLK